MLVWKCFGLRFLVERKAGRRHLLVRGSGFGAYELLAFRRILQGRIRFQQPIDQFAFRLLRGKIEGAQEQRQEGN
jgi:hypothetical protein